MLSLIYQNFSNFHVLKTLHGFATNKKSGYERESAAIAFQSFASILGAPVAPILLDSLPILLDLYMDKGEVVRNAATTAVKAILKLFPPESTRIVFRTLEAILENGKWRTKVGVLDAFRSFVTPARDAVAAELGATLPKIEAAMHDTKQEVSKCIFVLNSNSAFAGIIRGNQMRYLPLYYSRQPRPCTSYSSSSQVYVKPRLRSSMYQSFVEHHFCC